MQEVAGNLDTALTQLRTEQHRRREVESRLVELELVLVNKEHEVKMLQAELEEVSSDKDEMIESLLTSVKYLEGVIRDRDEDILGLKGLNGDIGTWISDLWNSEKQTHSVSRMRHRSNSDHAQGAGE